jgi:hypothetical protein
VGNLHYVHNVHAENQEVCAQMTRVGVHPFTCMFQSALQWHCQRIIPILMHSPCYRLVPGYLISSGLVSGPPSMKERLEWLWRINY